VQVKVAAQSLFCAPKPALALSLAILKGIVSSHGSVDLLRQPKPWLAFVVPFASHSVTLSLQFPCIPFLPWLPVFLADGRGAPGGFVGLLSLGTRSRVPSSQKRQGRHCLSYTWLLLETRRWLRLLLRLHYLRFSWLTRTAPSVRFVDSLRHPR
jgi:hypothetical protein